MWQPVIRPDCCRNYKQIPCKTFECFRRDIHKELRRLYCRHQNAFCSSHRIHNLARPKHTVKHIHVSKCPCMFAKPGDMVHPDECYTRNEQMALPSVRKLLLFKGTYKGLLKRTPKRLNVVNRLIRHSLFSLYSHLYGVQPPKPPIPIPKWDKAEWKKHNRTFNRLAIPKQLIESPPPENPRKPLSSLVRYKKLAIPHLRVIRQNPDWVFTRAMNNYKASERIRKICQPRFITPKWTPDAEATSASPGALKYKATERIINLAKPAEKRLAASELKDNPFTISPNALKYKATKRIKEIAEPREFENKHIRDKPFEISKKALTAKTTPRIMKLAEPKTRREKFAG